MKTLKTDQEIINILGLKYLARIICDTDKGQLKLAIRKGESNYHLILDSVPLEKNQNKEIMDLLFPVKQEEIITVNKVAYNKEPKVIVEDTSLLEVNTAHLHRGRPKGSKNK